MTWASDVLRYMESRQHLDGRTQKHKLLYYAQAWSLAWTGSPLFEDRIEAWINGPVVSDVWHKKSHPAGDLDAGQKAITDAVLTHYGEKTGEELSVLSHAERPWREARGDLPDNARGTTEITHDSMRREYTRQSLNGTGPVRPSTPLQDADPDHAVDLAAHMGQRWSRTLALLAE